MQNILYSWNVGHVQIPDIVPWNKRSVSAAESVQFVKEDDDAFETDLKRRWIFCTFDTLRNK